MRGPGTYTCEKFMTDRKNQPRVAEQIFYIWAQGFMTSQNMSTFSKTANGLKGYKDLDGNPEEHQATIALYCAKNPTKLFVWAVVDLWSSLPLKSVPVGR